MFESIEVDGLRGLHVGPLEGLKPVTLFVGGNGSGKSTVLEAIGVLCAGERVDEAFLALSRREWLGHAGMTAWFTGPAESARVCGVWSKRRAEVTLGLVPPRPELEHSARARGTTGPLRGLKLLKHPVGYDALIDEDGHIAISWVGAPRCTFALETAAVVDRPAGARRRLNEARFSSNLRLALRDVKLSPWYDDLVGYLRILRPSLSSIESLAVGDRDEPHVFEGEPRVGYPLAYAGDGFRRALLLSAAFARAKGGVTAVDEPEAFANPRLLTSLTKLVRRAVDDGTQVFFATHSLEFVRMTLEELKDMPERCVVVGLRNQRGRVDGIVVSGPDAYRRVVDMGDDLRL